MSRPVPGGNRTFRLIGIHFGTHGPRRPVKLIENVARRGVDVKSSSHKLGLEILFAIQSGLAPPIHDATSPLGYIDLYREGGPDVGPRGGSG
ncbi:MAG: hypothetical protein IID44_21735 [Planctomycetes bacterium]|nr:hypothetical protein [Planctomycetota bacterium]